MPVRALGRSLSFPPPDDAVDGLLAVGGDLSPERLLLAYSLGIFPWYDDDLPILWHSPDPRCVLLTGELHVGRTLRRVLDRDRYEVRYDGAFDRVVRECKTTPRRGQSGTWITDDMERAYLELHRMGYAHSVEAWEAGELAGGLYGVSLGRIFFGESMFSHRPNASKVALVRLAQRLAGWGYRVIDAQVPTPHTLAMGAQQWPRARFLETLKRELVHPTRRGSWAREPPFDETPSGTGAS